MSDLTFDEMINFAARHTSALSGCELIKNYKELLCRYDEIRERERVAGFLHMLLVDSNYYENYPKTSWTEEGIFNYLQKYEI